MHIQQLMLLLAFAALGAVFKSVAAIPFPQATGYDSAFLHKMMKSPICWSNLIRCEWNEDCGSAGDCSACYGYKQGVRMSGMCGRPHEEVSEEPTITPEQIRIAQGRDPTSMTVSWVTSAASDSVVEFSASPDFSTLTKVTGRTTNYTSHTNPDYVYQSGSIHHVRLEGLSPSKKYYYRVGVNAKEGGVSAIREFKTLPAVGDLSRPLSFALIGDLGQTANSAQTVKHMEVDPEIAAILHAGDMSYADCHDNLWDSWGNMVENVASKIPYMVAAGNHELETDPVLKIAFNAYKHRFAMPEVRPMEDTTREEDLPKSCTPSEHVGRFDYGNSFYSFEFGGVHAIILNSYSASNSTSNQYKWLEKDLKGIDRKKTPFVIALMHGPWYNTNQAHHDEAMSLNMKASMEPLFYQYNVNAVFSGHVHAYERTFEVYQNDTYVAGGAPMYFVIGDAGNEEGHASDYFQYAPWTAFRNGDEFGHSKVTVVNSTHMFYQWRRNVDPEMTIGDQVWIYNDESAWGKKSHRQIL